MGEHTIELRSSHDLLRRGRHDGSPDLSTVLQQLKGWLQEFLLD